MTFFNFFFPGAMYFVMAVFFAVPFNAGRCGFFTEVVVPALKFLSCAGVYVLSFWHDPSAGILATL